MTTAVRRIAIVGAGMGGLASAIALRQRGFEVKVYEQSPSLAAFGAGINLTPNAVKVFEGLNLVEKLRKVSFEPIGHIWRDWSDGSIKNVLPLDHARASYGSDYYVTHRSDLHNVLSSSVPETCIEAGKRCVGINAGKAGVELTFHDSSTAEADILIGCDGIRSVVRQQIFGGSGPRYAGHMCYRTLVPTSALSGDRHDDYVTQWAGKTGFVLSYYVRQGTFINIVAVTPRQEWQEESWSIPSTTEEMLESFSAVGPQLRELLSHGDDVFKWGQFTGEHADRWVKDRTALLGDAAHAMLATLGQGAAMAFEDSYVLAAFLDRYRDDYPTALKAYEETRRPRATQIQAMSRQEVRFKDLSSPQQRLEREKAYVENFGLTPPDVYRWIYGFDPRSL